MMTEISVNNKRIAKNTLFLYFRMLLTMGLELDAGRHFDFHLAHACGILVPESILYLRLDGRIRQGIIVLRGGNRDVLRRYAHADCGDYAAGAGP